jgi:hypothetical protein
MYLIEIWCDYDKLILRAWHRIACSDADGFFGFLGPGTERRGRVANTPASYVGDPGFKSRPGDRLS